MSSPAASAPADIIKSRGYLVLLVSGTIVGIPAATVVYFFLKLVAAGQQCFFTTLPGQLSLHGTPAWWPLPTLALCGLLVGLALRYLPGTGGHYAAEGFKTGGTVTARDLPGIMAASLATLVLGAVLGPEAPLVLIGAGVAVLIVHLVKKDAPAQAGLAVIFAEITGKGTDQVLFSGENALAPLSSTPPPGRRAPRSCSSSAKAWPAAYRSAASAAARPSPACSSAPPPGSPCPTCPACPSSTVPPWVSAR